MTLREIHRYERLLRDRRITLELALENSLDRLVVAHSADPMDQLVGLIEHDAESPAIRSLLHDLHRVEHALRAIHTREFGHCCSCGQPIPPDILRDAPWSRCCAECVPPSPVHTAASLQGLEAC